MLKASFVVDIYLKSSSYELRLHLKPWKLYGQKKMEAIRLGNQSDWCHGFPAWYLVVDIIGGCCWFLLQWKAEVSLKCKLWGNCVWSSQKWIAIFENGMIVLEISTVSGDYRIQISIHFVSETYKTRIQVFGK